MTNPFPYFQLLKQYGEAAGLSDEVAQLNPEDYKETPVATVRVTVDARSRHIVSLTPPGQSTSDEKYSAFGIQKAVQLPKSTISTAELQKRLNNQ